MTESGSLSEVVVPVGVLKVPTGIAGLDEVADGGLPRGRTMLVCGGPGCGKTPGAHPKASAATGENAIPAWQPSAADERQ